MKVFVLVLNHFMAAAADKVTAKLTTFSEGMIMNLSETVQAFKFYFGTLVESIYI